MSARCAPPERTWYRPIDAADLAVSVRRAVDCLVPPGCGASGGVARRRRHGGVPGPGADIPEEPSRLLQVADLDGVAAREMDGFATALVCPLVPTDRPTAGSSMGLLVVAAAEPVLFTLRGALEVLASQTALAVERVTLSQEVTRRNNEAYFRTLVQNAHDVILIVDDGGRIRYASPSAEAVLGPGSLLARPVLDLVAPATAMPPSVPVGRDARPGTRGYRLVRTDGARIDVEVTSRDLRDDPTVRGFVLTMRDITDQRKLEQELTHRACHDSLTGLANRVLFRDRVERRTAAGRSGVVGVLLVDLDDFKLVNDTMGHGIGDELLVAVAARLRRAASRRPRGPARRGRVRDPDRGRRRRSHVEEIASSFVDALAPRRHRQRPGHVREHRRGDDTGGDASPPRSCSATPTSPSTRRRAPARAGGASTSRHAPGRWSTGSRSDRAGAGDRLGRVRAALPADRRSPTRRDPRRRGARALAPPGAASSLPATSSTSPRRPGWSCRWARGS